MDKRRNLFWAERYGGGWERVKKLIDASVVARAELIREQKKAQTRKKLWWIVGFLGVALTVLSAMWLYAQNEATFAMSESAKANTARARAEGLVDEQQKTIASLKQVIDDLNHARGAGASPQALDLAVENATKDLYAQVGNLQRAARQTYAVAPPAAVPAGGLAPRVYVHIAAEDQRAAAAAFERAFEGLRIDDASIIVPGIEYVKASPSRSALRCFRAEECRTVAPKILALANSLLKSPQLTLDDQSSRYESTTNARPAHYEIWFAQGPIELAAGAVR